MKYLNKLMLLLVCTVFAGCEKHVIQYRGEQISDETVAQFQIHYMVPTTAGATNNINRVELNGKMLSNETTPLVTYNFLPSGSVGRFFATEPGKQSIKLYRGAVNDLTLVYERDFDLPAGKYNVIVHDFDAPPIIIKQEVPYPKVITEHTGATAWVKFYNVLYEEPGVPTPLTLQYQYQYTVDNATAEKSEWLNLGQPVSFGEATGWEPVPVNKTVEVSAGTARIDYRIRVIGSDGSDQGSLMVRNASGNMVEYSDWWNATIGRVVHHMYAGYRTTTPIAGVRQGFAL